MVKIDGEYIKEWLVLGPFFPDDLETDFLADVGEEANIHPQEGDTITTADGRTLTWKRHKSKPAIINLLDAVGEHDHATAYAFCVLQSETASDAEIRLESDDGVAVWINGEQVHSNPGHRPLILGQDVFEVHLKAGANLCLVKVFTEINDWEFAVWMTTLQPARAVISGTITDEKGKPIPDASVCLEQNGGEIAETATDASGNYRLNIHPVHGIYNLSAISGELGGWQLGIRLNEGERRILNLTLKESISIEGTLLMLDNATPHVAVPVQAIIPCSSARLEQASPPAVGRPIATTLSDESGKYRFINLKPGRYMVRCQILNGYVYYWSSTNYNGMEQTAIGEEFGEILQVSEDKTLEGIDFRFAPFKKGTWKNYDTMDGLAHNAVGQIYHEPDGVMWFGTEGGGVSRYDGKEFVNFTTEDGLVYNGVYAIHRDPDGVLWFGTGAYFWTERGSVSRFDAKSFVNFTTKDGLPHNIVFVIHREPDGMMWFGTWGGGVSRYDGKEFINSPRKNKQVLPINCGRVAFVVRHGTKWSARLTLLRFTS